MGSHPQFNMIYGVPITELGTYDEETELYTFEFNGKTVEFSRYDVPEMEDENKESWYKIFRDNPLELCYSLGDYGSEGIEEYIVGAKVWGMSGSCEVIEDYSPDIEKQEKVENLIKTINPEANPKMVGLLYIW